MRYMEVRYSPLYYNTVGDIQYLIDVWQQSVSK